MSQHLNMYSQKGCIGCKLCEGGAANIGRTAVLWALGICTAGIGLITLAFFKKCQYCGHNTFMNKHTSPAQQAPQQQQPVVQIHQTFQGTEAPTNTQN